MAPDDETPETAMSFAYRYRRWTISDTNLTLIVRTQVDAVVPGGGGGGTGGGVAGGGMGGQMGMTSLSAQTGLVNVDFTVYREAALNSTVGFYTTDFVDGGIRDTLTDTILRPGDAGYREAALANRLNVELTGENGQTKTFLAELTAGGFLATFLVAGGGDPLTGEVFFSHAGANASSNDHARLLGDNTFGFEDLSGLGDRDFNDMVVEFSIG